MALSTEAKRLLYCMLSAQVKTATPTPSGNSIQIRVAWVEPGGKRGLGYYTRYPSAIAKKATVPSEEFIRSIFRLKGNFHKLFTELATDDQWVQASEALVEEASRKLRGCVKSSRHVQVRKERERTKAKEYLQNALKYALNSRLQDDEVHELVKLAMVRHTMES